MEGLAGRASSVRRALYYCRGPTCDWPRVDRNDHRGVLHYDLRAGLYDHQVRERFRDGQDLRARNCADGAGRLADVVAEMGRPTDCALEPRQPITVKGHTGGPPRNTKNGRSHRRRWLQPVLTAV